MTDASALVADLRGALARAWRGPSHTLDLLLTTVLAGGHLLLEDVPGVGKTTLASSLARALGGRFRRIQCTADLLPGDITGVMVLGEGGELTFREGPLFAQVVLADEINRTPPRTQSALLEAMAEGSVSVDGRSRALPRPFCVVATQNPYDYHGTYPLPDSQLDRFLMRLSLGYPDREDERAILRQQAGVDQVDGPVVSVPAWLEAMTAVDGVRLTPEVEDHLLDLVAHTRQDRRLLRGVSPRGAAALHRAARAWALVKGRDYVIPEDVRGLAVPVLGHRVVCRGSTGTGGTVIEALVEALPPPR